MSAITETQARPMLWKVALASWIGTSIEWYDFFLYNTAAALVFDKIFFPELNPVIGHIAAFATFWVGFVARPVGGVVFGHFGDRIGRKAILVLTLIIMGLATFLIGLLPTYTQIGVGATVMLVVLRFAQGFAVGGEWGGAVLMTTESTGERNRGFFGSWPQMGVAIGTLLSSLMYSWSSHAFVGEQFLTFGWRIPFLFSIVLVVVGFVIRFQIEETPAFQALKEEQHIEKMPVIAVLRKEWKAVLLASGIFALVSGCAYLFRTHSMVYATEVLHMDRNDIFTATIIGSLVLLPVVPLAGILSDRVHRLFPIALGMLLLIGMAFPFYWLLQTESFLLFTLATVLTEIGCALVYAPMAALFSEMFETGTRFSGMSLAVQFTSVFVGGMIPMEATAMMHWSGNQSWPLSVYVLVVGAISVTALVITYQRFRVKQVAPQVQSQPA